MADNQKKKRKGPFGLSPLGMIAGAALLVVLGLAAGVALDIATRPDDARPKRAASSAPSVPPSPPRIFRDLAPGEDGDAHAPPSILAPRPPESAKPDTPRADAATSVPTAGDKAPMVAYAMAPPTNGPSAALAIVIDDMGLDRTRTQAVIALPAGVTVSLMTYADDLGGLTARARAAGHEVLAHVPMQPLSSKEDPGPHALTVGMDDSTIRATLGTDLDRWQGYVGVNNHMGSRFTLDRARMAVVMGELKSRGLLWLDSRTTTDTVGPAAAQTAGVPYVVRDIFLDNVETIDAVVEQLDRAIEAAKTHGTAIAIGHPHDTTIMALKQVLPTLRDRGVSLVPVTEILRRQQGHIRPS
ncbi:MAG: divergent polysaccharide deacetylase family protein [Rhodospirillaceae bacterium]|nr:MAG: divergent polysaccharide deacetylase family protein [Rhodospirillaceae bacterium]